MLTLTSLPVDIIIIVFESLGLHDFTALSLTCHLLYSIVVDYGWSSFLQSNQRPSRSLSNARALWTPHNRVRYDVMTDSAWQRSDFIARPLSRMWPGRFQTVMASSLSRLVVGAGSNLYSYSFGIAKSSTASPSVVFEGTISLLEHTDRNRNITALTFIEGGQDRILDIAFQDGAIERIHLIPMTSDTGHPILSFTRSKLAPFPNGDFVESLSSESNVILALSSNGHARLGSNHLDPSDTSPPSTIDVKSRSWVSHLCLQASTPYAAFGVSSNTPLNVHAIADGGQLSSQPTAILHTSKCADLPIDKLASSAVYGLSRGPMNSPWGSSPQILVSGWFDGQVRCYDLRSSSRSSPLSKYGHTAAGPAPLRPVLSLADRWSYEPIYSVSCGGGFGSHIAAGRARHSIISFWDIRSPKKGWSVHAPGNDSSPVYSVILESSRCFGVTQSRPFVYDFGPGVSIDTYPFIPQVKGIDNLKHKKGSNRVAYHVLRYEHNSSGLCAQ